MLHPFKPPTQSLPLWLESLPKILIFIQIALKTSKLENNKISLKEGGTKLQRSNFLTCLSKFHCGLCANSFNWASISFYHHFSLDGGYTATQFKTEVLNNFNPSDQISFPKSSPITSRKWICSIKKKQTRIVQIKMCFQFY